MDGAEYADKTAVPHNMAVDLPLLNEGDLAVVIYKDGRKMIGYVHVSNDRLRWFIGADILMEMQYAPFKCIVRDRDILTIVNLTLISANWPTRNK